MLTDEKYTATLTPALADEALAFVTKLSSLFSDEELSEGIDHLKKDGTPALLTDAEQIAVIREMAVYEELTERVQGLISIHMMADIASVSLDLTPEQEHTELVVRAAHDLAFMRYMSVAGPAAAKEGYPSAADFEKGLSDMLSYNPELASIDLGL